MSITATKDFQNSLQCLDCAYEDLGYNGSMKCIPRTKGCRAVYPYDMAMGSRIRKADLRHPTGSNGEGASGRVRGSGSAIKISREG